MNKLFAILILALIGSTAFAGPAENLSSDQTSAQESAMTVLSKGPEGWLVRYDYLGQDGVLENVSYGRGAAKTRHHGYLVYCTIPYKAVVRAECWSDGPVEPLPTPWNTCNDKRVKCPFTRWEL